MSSLLEAANAASTETKENKIEVTDKLPENVDDISIMTYRQLWAALNPNKVEHIEIPAPLDDSGVPVYYAYTVNDMSANNANMQALIDLGANWYKQYHISTEERKPITIDAEGHQIIGGPLVSVTYESAEPPVGSFCDFGYNITTEHGVACEHTVDYDYDYIESIGANIETTSHDSGRHIAVVKVKELDAANVGLNKIEVTDRLPTKVGDVSIMTMEQIYNALENSNSVNDKGHHYDQTPGYDRSTYYVYGIAGEYGSNSTAENLKDVDPNWYRELNTPTSITQTWARAGHKLPNNPLTSSQTFTSNGHIIFGGPLDVVCCDNSSNYDFYWYYSISDRDTSGFSSYWGEGDVSSLYVAVVRAHE